MTDMTERMQRVAPDGGWGWMVVTGSFIMHLLLGGLNRSYGVVYIHLRERFHSGSALTAWVGSASLAVRWFCSECQYYLHHKQM